MTSEAFLRPGWALLLSWAFLMVGCQDGGELACEARRECVCSTGEAIPAAWVCDGFHDCEDGEDERGCTEPEQPTEVKFDGTIDVRWVLYDPVLQWWLSEPGVDAASLYVTSDATAAELDVNGFPCSFQATLDPTHELSPELQERSCVAYEVHLETVSCYTYSGLYTVYDDGVESAWARWCGQEFEYGVVLQGSTVFDDSPIWYYFAGVED